MDSRIVDLSETLSHVELETYRSGLYFLLDSGVFSQAQKVHFVTLLTDNEEDVDNDYRAMTPKAFYDSEMSESKGGIGIIASDENISLETTGAKILVASKIPNIITKVSSYLHQNNGVTLDSRSAESLAAGGALVFNSTIDKVFSVSEKKILSPSIGAQSFKRLQIQYVLENVNSDLVTGGFITLTYSPGIESKVSVTVGGTTQGYFYISSDGGQFGFQSNFSAQFRIASNITTVIGTS